MRYLITFVFYDKELDTFVRICLAQCRELEDARIISHALLDRRGDANYSFCEIYDGEEHVTFMVMKED